MLDQIRNCRKRNNHNKEWLCAPSGEVMSGEHGEEHEGVAAAVSSIKWTPWILRPEAAGVEILRSVTSSDCTLQPLQHCVTTLQILSKHCHRIIKVIAKLCQMCHTPS